MKIWVIGRNYPDKKNNYQGSFELEQAKMLAKKGNDVTYIACVLHPFWRIKDGGFVEFKDDLVSVCAYSCFFTPHMTNPLIPNIYYSKIRNKRWSELLKRVEAITGIPDIIHIHFPLLVLSAEIFKAFHDRGVKIVITEHWSKVQNKRLDKYEKSQMQLYLKFADAYMAVGYLLKQAIIDISGTNRRIDIMPNMVNEAFRFDSGSHDGFNFGVVCRLVPEKQVDKIIKAFATRFKNKVGVKLIIVGDGKVRNKLEKLTDSLGVGSQVMFKGSLNRNETASIVKALDCLVCFSSFETFGVPVIEAWACGVPVITTTADCVTDTWDEKNGVSISCKDEDGLGIAMEHMAEGKNEYNRSYISGYALSHYSEDSIYHKLMDIYRG